MHNNGHISLAGQCLSLKKKLCERISDIEKYSQNRSPSPVQGRCHPLTTQSPAAVNEERRLSIGVHGPGGSTAAEG